MRRNPRALRSLIKLAVSRALGKLAAYEAEDPRYAAQPGEGDSLAKCLERFGTPLQDTEEPTMNGTSISPP